MNKNQIIKGLIKNEKAYLGLEDYIDFLKNSKMIKISLSHIKNLNLMSKQFDEFSRSKAVKFPFDNVFIDLHGYQMPNLLTGEKEIEDIGIHLIPMTFDLNNVSILSLLILDFRKYGKEIVYRTYLVYSDMAGLHVMANVDANSKDCQCFYRNVFWMNPNFKEQIKLKNPCHKNDVGLSLPDCAAINKTCSRTISQKSEISDLIRILLGYMSLPSNHIYKVIDTKNKINKEYFILADDKQLDLLVSGKDAETEGNEFTDGSYFKTMIDFDFKAPSSKKFKIKNKIYEFFSKEMDNDK